MHKIRDDAESISHPTYAARYFGAPVPKTEIPAEGMPSDAAYRLVRDELSLDGNPLLNLASFVTTWMEPEADQLALDAINKNLIDQDEYPQTEEIHRRVVGMLGRLLHVPGSGMPAGTATVGSSEAIMLGLLAHKRAWQNRRAAAGLDSERPNMVIGGDVHTCWEKFARYFEVEARVVPMSSDKYILAADDVRARVDERTIAVGALLGTTFTGQLDDLHGINALLAALESERGWHIPMHIDAASGGFVTPFYEPDFEWDFRLSQVRSINVSNHKYGLVYPGMGSVVFRERDDVPDELVFHINYLGGDMPTYSLNFSRAANTVVLQYYNFLRLGFEGYRSIIERLMQTSRVLFDRILDTGLFTRVGDGGHLPVIALRAAEPDRLDVYRVSEKLRERGWIVPAYTLPPNAQDIAVLRIVVKENFSRDMADMLVSDLSATCDRLLGRKRESPNQRERPIC